jgi:putative flavoprotein involved in K+ transport
MTFNDAADLIEEGTASIELADHPPRQAAPKREEFDVIVIGGGQAGLSVGYHLARAGARFVILDENERIGDSWRKRWDSLRLFTSAAFDGLDGMPFPAPRDHFPTKDEMAGYLEAYARHFRLPVRTGVRVERLGRRGSHYIVRAGAREFEADHVVVAMAKYQQPKVPAFAARLSRDITQLHSRTTGTVNCVRARFCSRAAAIGRRHPLEAARTGLNLMAGRDPGPVPFRPEQFWGATCSSRSSWASSSITF